MKKYLWITLILVFVLAIPALAASGTIQILVDGQELKSDVPAQLIEGRTMVPLRAIAEYFKKDVGWDSATQTVTITGMTDMEKVAAISAQWAAAGHGNLGRPLNYAGPRDGCQPCHSGNGFAQHLTDDKFTPQADKTAGAEYVDQPRPIDCATCHTGVGKELIETGIAKAELVPFADQDFSAPGSALCISCHNGRRDTKDMYQKWSSGEAKPTDYPHHAVGALFTGQGGMEYPDVTYTSSYAHQSIGCVSCHMPKTEDGLPSHEFGVKVEYVDQTCAACHKGATDFAMVDNLKAELGTMLEELQTAAVAAVPGAVAVGMSRTIFPFVDAEGKRVDLANVSTEAFVAAYNYYMLKDELDNYAGGAHNPQYAKSLIRESLKKLQ